MTTKQDFECRDEECAAPKGEDLDVPARRSIFHDLAFAADCAGKITDEAIEAAGGSYSGWKRLALVQAREIATLSSRCESLQADLEDLETVRTLARGHYRTIGDLRAELARERELTGELRAKCSKIEAPSPETRQGFDGTKV